MVAVALVAGLLIFLWWAQRARELFLISVRDGRALVVRGHIPGALLSDFKDALARAKVHRATLRALREDNGAQLAVRGVDEWTEQRLRNIFRVYPLSNLRSATGGERKTIWRVLGIAWLAWIFERNR